MAENFDFEKWRTRLHFCDDFATEDKCSEFLALLTVAQSNMSYPVAVEIIRTFSDADDFGVQERSRNILEAADKTIAYPALISELDGLIRRTHEKAWALTLAGIEFDYGAPELLIQYVMSTPEPQKSTFFSFIQSDAFLSEYPSALRYVKPY